MLKFLGFAKSGPIINSDQLNDRIDKAELNKETIEKLFGNLLSQHADTEIITLTENFHFQPIINQLKNKQQVKIQFNPLNVPFVYLLALAILKQDYQDYLIVSLAQNFTPDSQSEEQLNYLTTSIQKTTPYSNPDNARQIATSVLEQLKKPNEKLFNETHLEKLEEHQQEEPETPTVAPDTNGLEIQQQAEAVNTSPLSAPVSAPPPPPPPLPLPQGGTKPKIHASAQPATTEPARENKKPLNTPTGFAPPSSEDIKKHLEQLGTGQVTGCFKFPVTKGSGKHWPDPIAKIQSKPAPIEPSTQPLTTGGVDTSSISREQQFAAAKAIFSQKAQVLSQTATTLDASLKSTKTLSKKANPLQDLRIDKFKKLTNIAYLYMRIIGEEDNLANQLMEEKIAFYQKLGEKERQLTPLAYNASDEERSNWEKEHQTEIKQAQQFQSDTLFQADLFNSFIKEITPILAQMHSNIKENANAQELIKEIKTVIPDIDNLCVDAEDTAPKLTM